MIAEGSTTARSSIVIRSAAVALATLTIAKSLTACTPPAPTPPVVERLPDNPIVHPAMLEGNLGSSINGPSLVTAPPWEDAPLGAYYLYFAHHHGRDIRLAYSDDLAGPWFIYPNGVLRVKDTDCANFNGLIPHVASPDAHVDDDANQVRLYFHCPVYDPESGPSSFRQVSMVAVSNDGLRFESRPEQLGNSYFRVFKWRGFHYALGMPGIMYRSRSGLTEFLQGPTLFSKDMRHSAVVVRRDTLWVFYTNAGDRPERILLSSIALDKDWMEWRASRPAEVLRPKDAWEGADEPLRTSHRGIASGRRHELRDPAFFEEQGGQYLLYAVAGESGIAIARLAW